MRFSGGSAARRSRGERWLSARRMGSARRQSLIDFMRMHISACGGLNMARKTAAMCEFFGVRTAWHGPGNVSPIGHAVNTHSTSPFRTSAAAKDSLLATVQEIFPGCPERKNGMTYSNDLRAWASTSTRRRRRSCAPTPGTDRGVRC